MSRQWNPDCKGACDCPGEEVADLQAERCYCHSLDMPHVHTLGDHQKPSPERCLNHKLIQHRDRKPKWCNSCGKDARGVVIGGPRAFGRRVEPQVLTCPEPGCSGDGRYAPPGRGHTCQPRDFPLGA